MESSSSDPALPTEKIMAAQEQVFFVIVVAAREREKDADQALGGEQYKLGV